MRMLVPFVALAACQTAPAPVPTDGTLRYDGIETQLLDGDLVNFKVQIANAADDQDVIDYAACAAAQYALIRGFGFARNVRTLVDEQGGLWTGDAVYTISLAKPRGSQTIDAEMMVSDCARREIPTV